MRKLIEDALVEGNPQAFAKIRDLYLGWLAAQDLNRAQDIYFARPERLVLDFWRWVRG